MPEKYPHYTQDSTLYPDLQPLPEYAEEYARLTTLSPSRPSFSARVSAHLESTLSAPGFKRRFNRIGATVAAGMLVTTGIVVHNSMEDTKQASDMATADYAPESPSLQYGVVNAPDGIYSRNSPHTSDTPRIAGQGVYNGDTVQLICGVTNGDAVGNNQNNTWHKVKNLTRPNQPDFFLNDYYIASPNVADQLAPNEPQCDVATVPQLPEQPRTNVGETLPPNPNPQPTPEEQKNCYFNLKWSKRNLTFSYEGEHRYYGNVWQAAKNWTDLNAGISITPAPEGTVGDVVFKDELMFQDELRRTWYGHAEIPQEIEFSQDRITTPPPSAYDPSNLSVKFSKPYMDQLDDELRTYVATHELGHILGLAHVEFCGIYKDSVMSAGKRGKKLTDSDNRPKFNKPQEYDRIALKMLYGG